MFGLQTEPRPDLARRLTANGFQLERAEAAIKLRGRPIRASS